MTYGTGLTKWLPRNEPTPDATVVHVFIGRGHKDGGEMTAERWGDFQREVEETIKASVTYIDTFFAVTGGTTEWDGRPEESAVFTAIGEVPISDIIALRRRLSDLAYDYNQEAIAFTTGRSSLVPPFVPVQRAEHLL